jgi:hypothetical protein
MARLVAAPNRHRVPGTTWRWDVHTFRPGYELTRRLQPCGFRDDPSRPLRYRDGVAVKLSRSRFLFLVNWGDRRPR